MACGMGAVSTRSTRDGGGSSGGSSRSRRLVRNTEQSQAHTNTGSARCTAACRRRRDDGTIVRIQGRSHGCRAEERGAGGVGPTRGCGRGSVDAGAPGASGADHAVANGAVCRVRRVCDTREGGARHIGRRHSPRRRRRERDGIGRVQGSLRRCRRSAGARAPVEAEAWDGNASEGRCHRRRLRDSRAAVRARGRDAATSVLVALVGLALDPFTEDRKAARRHTARRRVSVAPLTSSVAGGSPITAAHPLRRRLRVGR